MRVMSFQAGQIDQVPFVSRGKLGVAGRFRRQVELVLQCVSCPTIRDQEIGVEKAPESCPP